jgi:hypothetical protein
MKAMRKPIHSSLLFCVFALIGPAMRLIIWPILNWEKSSKITSYIYDLVLLLWPVGLIAVMENVTGTFIAQLLATIANIALFGLIGAIIGFVAKRKSTLLICYVVLCLLILLLELWGAGYSMEFINISALLTAFLVYGLPFYYLWEAKGTGEAKGT